uniref:Uncharacterized protein n=1 Tax=Arion vulgaris TaxID=1028688 RepID=A0A0B7AHQ6_9EUPU
MLVTVLDTIPGFIVSLDQTKSSKVSLTEILQMHNVWCKSFYDTAGCKKV